MTEPLGSPYIVIAVVCLATGLPFLNQAFHIDDEVYLRLADGWRIFAWDFYRQSDFLFGKDWPLVLHSQHPPLAQWYLAGWRALGLHTEWSLHAAYMMWTLLAGFSIFGFAKRFTDKPLILTLAFILSPAFMVSSHTLMTDVPFVALFFLALTVWIQGIDEGQHTKLVGAAILACACVLVQYRGLMLPVFMLVYAWNQRDQFKSIFALAFAPFVVVIVFELWVSSTTEASAFGESVGFLDFTPTRMLESVAFYAAGIGLCCLPFLPRHIFQNKVQLLIFSVVGVTLFFLHARDASLINTIWGTVLMIVGAWACSSLFRHFSPRLSQWSTETTLAIWGLATMGGLVVLSLFACMRNLLIVLPFVFLLLARKYPQSFSLGRVGLGALLALLCSVADYQWAGQYRSYANQIAESQENHTHFVAAEWGFRHYTNAHQMDYLLDSTTDLRLGDRIIRPTLAAPENVIHPEMFARLRLVEERRVYSSLPITLMSRYRQNCGWYAQGFGVLPLCLGSLMTEQFRVYSVQW